MSNAPRPHWRPHELQLLRELYPHHHTDLVAAAVGRPAQACYRMASTLGLRKSRECIARVASERTSIPGHGSHQHRFKPGAQAWNKGLRGATGTHPNTALHHFLPGRIQGRAAQLLQPVGAERVNDDGVLQRKISDDAMPPHTRWRAVHRLVWEAAHGPVPAGHVVAFRPGMRTVTADDITTDRLELITRAENMRRNSHHTMLPPEVSRLVQLRGVLSRQINSKARKAEQ
jgi:hypothetical protein